MGWLKQLTLGHPVLFLLPAAIRQWDQALRERNEYRETMLKVQRQHEDAMKEVNHSMSARMKAGQDVKRIAEERNAAVQVGLRTQCGLKGTGCKQGMILKSWDIVLCVMSDCPYVCLWVRNGMKSKFSVPHEPYCLNLNLPVAPVGVQARDVREGLGAHGD